MIFYEIPEIWKRRDLLRELVAKDLKIRYSRRSLGFFWAFLSPLITVVIFYIVFYLILKVEIKEAPFVLYLMSSLFPWQFFQSSLANSVTSLMDNKNLIRESGCSHYLIPISIVLANAINFLPALFILVITSLFLLKGLSIFILFLPVVLFVHLTVTIGLSIVVSLLYVRYRDTKYVLDAVLLLLLYLTPAFYSIALVKSVFGPFLFKLYIDNPFVGITNLYRITILKGFYGVFKNDLGLLSVILMPVSFALLTLILGFYLYGKNKKHINDYLSY